MASPYQLTIIQADKFKLLDANIIKTAYFAPSGLP
jgi:hypothetical protein